MKNITFLLFLFSMTAFGQEAENVVLITLDGVRWQEVFQGVDKVLLQDDRYTENIKKTEAEFWDNDHKVRRSILMPFLWSKINSDGVILGNRKLGSRVDIKNDYGFSYPGYNEMLTGFPDPKVNSNEKKDNVNTTFLEYMNQQKGFENTVAAFATWGVFPYIINESRAHIPVNAGIEESNLTKSESESLLNEILTKVPSLASNRFDFLTYFLAKDYVKEKEPRVLFIAFDETDEFGHEAKYREYLYAINTIDNYIRDLWNYYQSQEKYRNKTTFIITTDHGRGDAIKDQWTSHGQKVKDCGSIWIAAIGPGIPSVGESRAKEQYYQNQVAATICHELGYTFKNGLEIGSFITWPKGD